MKRTLWEVPAVGLLLAVFVLAQANVSLPEPAKHPAPPPAPAPARTPASTPATNPASDCRPEPTMNASGELEFTGCSEKPERVDRSKLDPSAGPARSATESQRGAPSPTELDPQTRAKQQEALRAKYDYQAFSFTHAKRTFDFQYRSGRIIFWVVLLIVFAGLAFSAVQFYVGLRHPLESRVKGDGKESGPNDDSVSEFEATLQGIKLKSSVLGLLILAMSMVFFYLYLKYVYPITNVSQ
jgi:hypothetical protein